MWSGSPAESNRKKPRTAPVSLSNISNVFSNRLPSYTSVSLSKFIESYTKKGFTIYWSNLRKNDFEKKKTNFEETKKFLKN